MSINLVYITAVIPDNMKMCFILTSKYFTVMDIRPTLEQFDLSDKEIDIYLACLTLGESTIMPIARKVGLPRSTVLYALECLRNQGLISIAERNGRRIYLPLPPRTLLTLLKRKREALDEQIGLVEDSLPQLNQLFTSSPFEPKARIYRGQDELRQIYEEMLEAPVNEIWYVGDYSEIVEALGRQFMRNWVHRRAATGIKAKAIRIRTGEVADAEFAPKTFLRSVRYAPDTFESPSHIQVYGDIVVIITTAKESFGIVVTSRDYATTVKSWFRELWKVSSEK
jgi:HTH-type transcriptional regulator, sugar sensing transcriptional regulator